METFQHVNTPGEFARSRLLYGLIGGCDAPKGAFLYTRDYYPAYEIMLVTKGQGAFKHANRWIDVVEGDCVLHDMRLPHAYRTEDQDPFEMDYLVFDGADMEHYWPKLFGGASCVVLQALPRANPAQRLLAELIGAMADDAASELAQSVRLYELLLEVCRLKQELGASPQAGHGAEPEALKRAKAHIDAHYLDVEDVAELASVAALSLYHFIRQFKKQYGVTPKEYVLLKRVRHAKRLLANTSLSVGETGQRSGFASYNAFLHAFLRIEKASPRDFRKSLRRF
ncbi:helix-turn-helix transcriptional regulator [Paenibacillus sp. MWE-103]|uniref:Helix-turn-helix transcriptional regulator n=1 Tax=Paenibacillus artemisiicola TaxID=1172618 RepID=A0ABS3WDU8_9BACL|nr:AraC family transcriptional regulator [Paenibacillus artemisiicola]MBO7746442.1 helix-turn-helix transcriptional regulator [Paenibacillus artemisiicola]